MAFHFLSQLDQNAGYEVEDEDRSSPVDEEEGENEESDIELGPEDARARGNGNRANANLDLVTLRRVPLPALNQTMSLLGRQNFMTLKLRCSPNTQAHYFF